MASIMGKRAILGKNTRLFLLLFALWAANLCAGGVLPTSFGPYRNGTTTINTTASSPGTSSPPPQVGPGQGVINTAHSPTEYWCFDIFHLSYVECCGLGDDADECNHAAVCFDQVDCEEGCELDMPTSAESGTISFTWYAFLGISGSFPEVESLTMSSLYQQRCGYRDLRHGCDYTQWRWHCDDQLHLELRCGYDYCYYFRDFTRHYSFDDGESLGKWQWDY